MRVDRGAAAQEAGDEIAVDLRHQRGLAGVGHRAHGEAAGDMDRGPQRRGAVVEPGDVGLVGEIGDCDQHDLRVAAMREALPPPLSCT